MDEGNMQKAELSDGTLPENRSGQKKLKEIKGKTLCIPRQPGGDLSSLLLPKLYNTKPNTLRTVFFSLSQFLAIIDKEWLPDVCKAPHLCLDVPFYFYASV